MLLILHSGKEAEKYAKKGATAYTQIGQMYSSYLSRDAKEKIRNKFN